MVKIWSLTYCTDFEFDYELGSLLKTSCIHQNGVAFFKLVSTLVQVNTVFAL